MNRSKVQAAISLIRNAEACLEGARALLDEADEGDYEHAYCRTKEEVRSALCDLAGGPERLEGLLARS